MIRWVFFTEADKILKPADNRIDHFEEEIFRELKHGVTKLDAMGSYNNTKKTLLICVVNKNQISDFKNILYKYDDTFSYCETISETYGNFKKIKK